MESTQNNVTQNNAIEIRTAIEAHRAAAGYSVYASYKAALTSFSRSMAVELGRDNIRINTVATENFRTSRVARIRRPWSGSIPVERKSSTWPASRCTWL
jgi:NAD(P)-dependent dehydrogenase (short-subunit alcohol dehydrogenase family)